MNQNHQKIIVLKSNMDRNIEIETYNTFEIDTDILRESNVLERIVFYIEHPRIFVQRLVRSVATLQWLL
jgi:hypothetical protein